MHVGPTLYKDNLIFGFDSGASTLGNGKDNPKRTGGNKGRPTVNYYTNGHFSKGNGISQEGGSNSQNDIIELPNPGDSAYVLRQTMGVYYTEYQINLSTQLSASTTYCMSGWYAESADYNASSRMFHCRAYSASGAHVALGTGLYNVLKTVVVGGLTWKFCYATITTPSDYSNTFNWYLGYGGDTYAGARYYTNIQMEVGSYPSAFVDGTRSSTQSLFDVTRNVTLNASTVDFNSTDIPVFDGTNSYIDLPTAIFPAMSQITIELVNFGIDARNSSVIAGGVGGNQDLNIHLPWGDGNIYWDVGRPFNRVYKAAGSDYIGWHHWIFTKNPSTGIMKIYRDGVEWASNTGQTSSIISLSGGVASFGRYSNGSTNNYYHNGTVPVLKIYNKELSTTEIQRNFNSYKTRFGL